MHLFIVGAGHVGLVTAIGFARLGYTVTVTDVDADRIARINAGEPPFFEPGMAEALRYNLASGRLRPTTATRPPSDAPYSIVCVPTPSGDDGILSMAHVEAAVAALLDATGPDHAIVVRSTLPLHGPDRLDALVADRPSRAAVAVNPEFMREGSALRDFDEQSRVVVGALAPADEPAAAAFAKLYAPLGRPTLVTDARTAALVKLASNGFLATKIAFANELARLADAIGADAATAVDGIGLDARIGRAFLSPGPGYGGSCLPEQAVTLEREAAARDVPVALLAGLARANATHQAALVERLAADLGGSVEGRRVAVLGLAFKARTDDVRHSPGLALAAALRQGGASVVGHDPMAAAQARRADPDLEVADTIEAAVEAADAVLIATEWADYAGLDWGAVAGRMRGDLVHDTRAIVDAEAVAAAGLRLVPLGRAAVAARVAEAEPTAAG